LIIVFVLFFLFFLSFFLQKSLCLRSKEPKRKPKREDTRLWEKPKPRSPDNGVLMAKLQKARNIMDGKDSQTKTNNNRTLIRDSSDTSLKVR